MKSTALVTNSKEELIELEEDFNIIQDISQDNPLDQNQNPYDNLYPHLSKTKKPTDTKVSSWCPQDPSKQDFNINVNIKISLRKSSPKPSPQKTSQYKIPSTSAEKKVPAIRKYVSYSKPQSPTRFSRPQSPSKNNSFKKENTKLYKNRNIKSGKFNKSFNDYCDFDNFVNSNAGKGLDNNSTPYQVYFGKEHIKKQIDDNNMANTDNSIKNSVQTIKPPFQENFLKKLSIHKNIYRLSNSSRNQDGSIQIENADDSKKKLLSGDQKNQSNCIETNDDCGNVRIDDSKKTDEKNMHYLSIEDASMRKNLYQQIMKEMKRVESIVQKNHLNDINSLKIDNKNDRFDQKSNFCSNFGNFEDNLNSISPFCIKMGELFLENNICPTSFSNSNQQASQNQHQNQSQSDRLKKNKNPETKNSAKINLEFQQDFPDYGLSDGFQIGKNSENCSQNKSNYHKLRQQTNQLQVKMKQKQKLKQSEVTQPIAITNIDNTISTAQLSQNRFVFTNNSNNLIQYNNTFNKYLERRFIKNKSPTCTATTCKKSSSSTFRVIGKKPPNENQSNCLIPNVRNNLIGQNYIDGLLDDLPKGCNNQLKFCNNSHQSIEKSNDNSKNLQNFMETKKKREDLLCRNNSQQFCEISEIENKLLSVAKQTPNYNMTNSDVLTNKNSRLYNPMNKNSSNRYIEKPGFKKSISNGFVDIPTTGDLKLSCHVNDNQNARSSVGRGSNKYDFFQSKKGSRTCLKKNSFMTKCNLVSIAESCTPIENQHKVQANSGNIVNSLETTKFNLFQNINKLNPVSRNNKEISINFPTKLTSTTKDNNKKSANTNIRLKSANQPGNNYSKEGFGKKMPDKTLGISKSSIMSPREVRKGILQKKDAWEKNLKYFPKEDYSRKYEKNMDESNGLAKVVQQIIGGFKHEFKLYIDDKSGVKSNRNYRNGNGRISNAK